MNKLHNAKVKCKNYSLFFECGEIKFQEFTMVEKFNEHAVYDDFQNIYLVNKFIDGYVNKYHSYRCSLSIPDSAFMNIFKNIFYSFFFGKLTIFCIFIIVQFFIQK